MRVALALGVQALGHIAVFVRVVGVVESSSPEAPTQEIKLSNHFMLRNANVIKKNNIVVLSCAYQWQKSLEMINKFSGLSK